MSEQPSCACDLFVHPAVIDNLPGLPSLVYRLGDFTSFRRALLLARPGEKELAAWRPGGRGDLALQLVEWWAVIADILTFYNELAVQEAFLRTAALPRSVTNLVRLLGYRPRPGIGSVGTVAALVSGRKPVTVPKGFQIQSKPGPGKEPQIFEVDADTVAGLPDEVDVDPAPDPKLFVLDGVNGGGHSSLLLAGNVTSVKAGDRLLLRRRVWTGAASQALLVTVQETKKETSPRGAKNTRVVFAQNHGLGSELAADWLLLRNTQSAALFSTANEPIETLSTRDSALDTVVSERVAFSAAAAQVTSTVSESVAFELGLGGVLGSLSDNVFGDFFDIGDVATPNVPPVINTIIGQAVHLEAVRTPIDPGDALLLELGSDARIAFVKAHGRQVWYQNAAASSPATPPGGENVVPIPVLHSVIRINTLFSSADRTTWNSRSDEVKAGYAWVEVGTIIGKPSTLFSANAATATLLAAEADAARLAGQANVMIADADGVGTRARVTTATAAQVALESIETLAQPLTAPLELLANLIGVSRGKTVAAEVLGSGDAAQSGQEFVLKKSPLTYLQSGDGYRSTLRVFVDGVEWTEAPSFYGQAAEGKVFVTKEDADNKTHVLFGDGLSGARLPSGTNNVVASYRYGSRACAASATPSPPSAAPIPTRRRRSAPTRRARCSPSGGPSPPTTMKSSPPALRAWRGRAPRGPSTPPSSGPWSRSTSATTRGRPTPPARPSLSPTIPTSG
jgi:hypothetical protein